MTAWLLAGVVVFSGPTPLLRALETRYSISVAYPQVRPSAFKSVTFDSLSASDSPALEKYSWLLAEEFNKYPKDFIARIGLKTIALVKNIKYEGDARTAIPDYKAGILFLDIIEGAAANGFGRHVMHHEIYHFAEAALNGDPFFKDPAWAALNKIGFTYGQGGAYARGKDQAVLTHPSPGFVDKYAQSGLEEDKAEIFACLMVPVEARRLAQMAADDPILAAKAKFIQQACAGWSPSMGRPFFEAIAMRR